MSHDHGSMASGSMDHSGMDHSGMDHSGMDHGNMGDMGSSHSMMDMAPMGTFHWSAEQTDGLWLESWVPATQSAYIGACFGLLFFAIFSRGLVALEMYFIAWRANASQRRQHDTQYHAVNIYFVYFYRISSQSVSLYIYATGTW